MSTGDQLWDEFVGDSVPPLSPEQRQHFAYKRLLITGAGGFIGSALARMLTRIPLDRLILLDNAEYGLYRLEQDLKESGAAIPTNFVVGSVADRALLQEVFLQHAPQIIFHAAALKHVPLMEANALAAAEINVLGTEALVDAAAQSRAEQVVLLSTDKAVEPISVMGATKRLAELVILAAQQNHRSATAFVAVRLCNVLGSTGSVAPLFVRQIARGGPMTVTDLNATRYFVSISDVVQILLHAAAQLPAPGLLVPKLENAQSIDALAAYLRGRAGDRAKQIETIYTGLRPADKLHESLISPSESIRSQESGHLLLTIESAVPAAVQLATILDELRIAIKHRRTDRLLDTIRRAVPTYPGRHHASEARGPVCV